MTSAVETMRRAIATLRPGQCIDIDEQLVIDCQAEWARSPFVKASGAALAEIKSNDFLFCGVVLFFEAIGTWQAWRPTPALNHVMQQARTLIEQPQDTEIEIELDQKALVEEIIGDFWKYCRVVNWLANFGIVVFVKDNRMRLKRITGMR